MPPEKAALAARTVVYYVFGFTVDEQSRLQWDAAGLRWPMASRYWRRTRPASSPSGWRC